MPPWVAPLGATLLMQAVASGLGQTLPVIAPLLTGAAGLRPESIGPLNAVGAAGTVLFLLFGGALLARLGPVRALQAGTAASAFGLLLAGFGTLPALVLAALLLGLGYGPTPPAGSRILAATAPPQHRTLIFSVKQAGAPVGGALAGLILAPIAAAWGWRVAVCVAAIVGIAAAVIINPVRRQLDEEKRREQSIGLATLFSLQAIIEPFAALGANRALLAVSSLAFSFAIVQGSLFSFSVTYLVTDRGLTLGNAAFAYACLQGSGAIARIFLGWLADRTGRPARNLAIQAMVAAGLVVAYGSLPTLPPLWLAALIAGAAGFSAASWNGIFMAEIARLSPPDRVAEATASSTLCAFLGYVTGPSLFSLLVTLSGRYQLAFCVVAAQLLCMALLQFTPMARAPAPRMQEPSAG
jgi:MFS family permease